MTKFEKVSKALVESTRGTGNWVRLTKNVAAGSKGKYATQNVLNAAASLRTFKTLDEVIEKYGLEI